MEEEVEDMDAQVVEVDGLEMGHSETCHHGNDPDGSMDVVRVGIWGIIQALALMFHKFRQVVIYKPYRIKKSFLNNNSRTFKTAYRTSKNDYQSFRNSRKITTDENKTKE